MTISQITCSLCPNSTSILQLRPGQNTIPIFRSLGWSFESWDRVLCPDCQRKQQRQITRHMVILDEPTRNFR